MRKSYNFFMSCHRLFEPVVPKRFQDNNDIHSVKNVNGYHQPVTTYYQYSVQPYQYLSYQPVQYQLLMLPKQYYKIKYNTYRPVITSRRIIRTLPNLIANNIGTMPQTNSKVSYQTIGMDTTKVPYDIRSYEPDEFGNKYYGDGSIEYANDNIITDPTRNNLNTVNTNLYLQY